MALPGALQRRVQPLPALTDAPTTATRACRPAGARRSTTRPALRLGLVVTSVGFAQALLMTNHAELFLYPGDRHLFADNSLPSYDAGAAALLTRRVLDFLATR